MRLTDRLLHTLYIIVNNAQHSIPLTPFSATYADRTMIHKFAKVA